MQWVAKAPPIYVWSADTWYNEKDGFVYIPNMDKQCWQCEEFTHPFTKKTRVMHEK